MEQYKEQLQAATFIYQSAWFLCAPHGPACIEAMAHHCTQHKLEFGFNLSAPMVIESKLDQMMKILPHTTFVFGNNTEACKFAEMMNWNEVEDIATIAQQIAKLPVCHGRARIVIITQGPAKTIIVSRDGLVTTFQPLLIRQNLVIDTTGAGDAFCGGFISHLLEHPRKHNEFENDVLFDAIEKGHWAAREIIQRDGCSFPTRCQFDSWKKGIAESEYPRANA